MFMLKKIIEKFVQLKPQSRPSHFAKRRLRMECLENRELLSVTTGDFADIRANYADLNLSANAADYNLIEIQSSNLTEQNLRSAIVSAGNTNVVDIVVLRTTSSQHTLDLNAQVDIATSTASLGNNMKGIIFVSLGSENLTINANNHRGFMIDSVDVAFAGVNIENGRVVTALTARNGGVI
jgi:hypothetical protein